MIIGQNIKFKLNNTPAFWHDMRVMSNFMSQSVYQIDTTFDPTNQCLRFTFQVITYCIYIMMEIQIYFRHRHSTLIKEPSDHDGLIKRLKSYLVPLLLKFFL